MPPWSIDWNDRPTMRGPLTFSESGRQGTDPAGYPGTGTLGKLEAGCKPPHFYSLLLGIRAIMLWTRAVT